MPPAPTLSLPTFLHSPIEFAPVPAPPPAGEPPIPLSFVFAHVSRSCLPVLARVSKRFSAAMQLVLYRTLDLSADDADTCVARLAGARPSRCVSTRPRTTHLIVLVLALALRSMRAPLALTLTTFDANLLAAALGMLTHLTLLAGPLPYA
ncbi:hypothetical protein EDB83DRAFT_2445419 [Lactarius deliciosus]|nr:hypothetical protein EDB83DRAFT_2445419 [Lactarius deliciosus]